MKKANKMRVNKNKKSQKNIKRNKKNQNLLKKNYIVKLVILKLIYLITTQS